MPERIKITTKTGDVIYDTSWIPGVDYENNNENDHDIDTENFDEYNNTDNESDTDTECTDKKNIPTKYILMVNMTTGQTRKIKIMKKSNKIMSHTTDLMKTVRTTSKTNTKKKILSAIL